MAQRKPTASKPTSPPPTPPPSFSSPPRPPRTLVIRKGTPFSVFVCKNGLYPDVLQKITNESEHFWMAELCESGVCQQIEGYFGYLVQKKEKNGKLK